MARGKAETKAIRRLYQDLGITNAVRFLKRFTIGFEDYTRERETLLGSKTLDIR